MLLKAPLWFFQSFVHLSLRLPWWKENKGSSWHRNLLWRGCFRPQSALFQVKNVSIIATLGSQATAFASPGAWHRRTCHESQEMLHNPKVFSEDYHFFINEVLLYLLDNNKLPSFFCSHFRHIVGLLSKLQAFFESLNHLS